MKLIIILLMAGAARAALPLPEFVLWDIRREHRPELLAQFRYLEAGEYRMFSGGALYQVPVSILTTLAVGPQAYLSGIVERQTVRMRINHARNAWQAHADLEAGPASVSSAEAGLARYGRRWYLAGTAAATARLDETPLMWRSPTAAAAFSVAGSWQPAGRLFLSASYAGTAADSAVFDGGTDRQTTGLYGSLYLWGSPEEAAGGAFDRYDNLQPHRPTRSLAAVAGHTAEFTGSAARSYVSAGAVFSLPLSARAGLSAEYSAAVAAGGTPAVRTGGGAEVYLYLSGRFGIIAAGRAQRGQLSTDNFTEFTFSAHYNL